MASSYALPFAGTTHAHAHNHGRGHQYSHSQPQSYSPSHTRSPARPTTSIRKPSTNGLIHSHHSHSHSAAPQLSPHLEDHSPYRDENDSNHDEDITYSQSFTNNTTSPKRYMRGRPRGESDLGRPPLKSNGSYGFSGAARASSASRNPDTSNSFLTVTEALTALLIPLPYLLASYAYPTTTEYNATSTTAQDLKQRLKEVVLGETSAASTTQALPFDLIQACTLTSGTLLLVGLLGRIRAAERVLDRRKGGTGGAATTGNSLSIESVKRVSSRCLSVGLPFIAATNIGGVRTGAFLLTAITGSLTSLDNRLRSMQSGGSIWQSVVSQKYTSALMLAVFFCDWFGISSDVTHPTATLGYCAIAASILLFPPSLPSLSTGVSAINRPRPSFSHTSAVPSTPWETPAATPRVANPTAASPLLSSPQDVNLTLAAGTILSVCTVVASVVSTTHPPVSFTSLIVSTCSVACAAASIFFAQPLFLRTKKKVGLALGLMTISLFDLLAAPEHTTLTLIQPVIAGLFWITGLLDTRKAGRAPKMSPIQEAAPKTSRPASGSQDVDWIGRVLLSLCGSGWWGLQFREILQDRNSRRIMYFIVFNFSFMFIEFFYGWYSGSLGLVSDGIHMFFDCLSQFIGLVALVMSKWPPTQRFPFGYAKIDSLSGFANAVFLMLMSVEFIVEAIARVIEGHEMKHVNELMIVSIGGLLVNLVGVWVFSDIPHSHGGETCDHGHSHSHSHENGHADSHDHGHGHDHHHHHSENMHGIYLHILADALGSVAVIASTAMVIWKDWHWCDPVVSIVISIYIVNHTWPLLWSSAQKLLLTIPDNVEYTLRTTLQEISGIRGVVGYAAPKFWLAGSAARVLDHDDHGHGHSHGHSHEHHEKQHDDHDHDHDHGHSHGHLHSHGSGHHHDHSHDHQAHTHTHTHQDHSIKGVPAGQALLGVIHIIASRSADLEDVRARVSKSLENKHMDVLVHVEREGEGRCWCGGGVNRQSRSD